MRWPQGPRSTRAHRGLLLAVSADREHPNADTPAAGSQQRINNRASAPASCASCAATISSSSKYRAGGIVSAPSANADSTAVTAAANLSAATVYNNMNSRVIPAVMSRLRGITGSSPSAAEKFAAAVTAVESALADGALTMPPARYFELEDIVEAHEAQEAASSERLLIRC